MIATTAAKQLNKLLPLIWFWQIARVRITVFNTLTYVTILL